MNNTTSSMPEADLPKNTFPKDVTGNSSLNFLAVLERITKSYLFRTLIQALFTVWLVLTVTFFLIRLLPSNPVEIYIEQMMQSRDMTRDEAQARAEQIFANAGFDKPLPQQYAEFLRRILSGDLGASIRSETPVAKIIAEVLPWTLFVVGLALLSSFTIGLFVGMLMAYFRNSPFDYIMNAVASFLSSMPNYLFAILVVYFFGVRLKWFNIADARGNFTPGMQPAFTLEFFFDILKHAALPILANLMGAFGTWALTMRNSTIGVLGEEYVNAAHARGLGQWRILTAYVGRNAALPLFTQLALSIGFVVGGSVVIERYFLYPGIGNRLLTAVSERDYPIMQGVFLVITITVVLSNVLADLLYSRLDPRVRVTKGG